MNIGGFSIRTPKNKHYSVRIESGLDGNLRTFPTAGPNQNHPLHIGRDFTDLRRVISKTGDSVISSWRLPIAA